MSLTPSQMLPLGTKAPAFTLLNPANDEQFSLENQPKYPATVVMFICNHCPYVIHIQEQLVKLANDYIPQQVNFIAINSNDIETYPEDAPEKMVEVAKQLNFPFPYLFDEDQTVAKAYQAACTPDFYLFDDELACVYRGQLDDSRPGNDVPVTGKDLRAALDAVLANQPVNLDQKPSTGCNIKWKKA